jgi:hypothetical protein
MEEHIMSTVTQKEAVFQAVINVCGEQDGGAYTPTKEERGQVNNILFEGFQQGTIAYDGEIPSESDLKAYVSGLQSNWLRKDKRLNGNVTYVAKNPGSRAGSTDSQVKAMRLLLSSGRVTDEVERTKIQSMIQARLASIKPTKTVEINVADLPEELKHLA